MKTVYNLLLTCLLLSVTANCHYPDLLLTAYSCPGNDLDIECDEGKVIHIIRAIYGRVSNTSICNDIGQDDLSVNCFSFKSFLVMEEKCSQKQNCSVRASGRTVGDPCPFTVKYLEVQYQCVSPEVPTTVITTSVITEAPTTVITTSVISELPNHCPPIIMYDIKWNWTKAGTTAIHQCPGHTIGLARWHCGSDPADWVTSEPDLSECRSRWIVNLKERIHSGESINSLAAELALMRYSKTLYANDLKDTLDIIQQILSKAVNGMENFRDSWHRYHVLREVLQYLVETISILLKQDQRGWRDLSPTDRRRVASSLLDSLEESALLFVQSSDREEPFSLAETNVFLTVQVLNARSTLPVQFPIADEVDRVRAWIGMDDTLVLPAEVLMDISKQGLVKIVFVLYSGVGEVMKPDKNSMYRNSKENSIWRINSKVIAASIGKQELTTLSQPAIITFKHLEEENMSNPICVYWDFNTREWSDNGCWVQASNMSHTVCACNCLANFAVIMESTDAKEVPLKQDVWQGKITVGFGIFIFCLVLTVIPAFLLRKKIIEIAQQIISKLFFLKRKKPELTPIDIPNR